MLFEYHRLSTSFTKYFTHPEHASKLHTLAWPSLPYTPPKLYWPFIYLINVWLQHACWVNEKTFTSHLKLVLKYILRYSFIYGWLRTIGIISGSVRSVRFISMRISTPNVFRFFSGRLKTSKFEMFLNDKKNRQY